MPKCLNLHDFDLIIINSSAGKDSLAALWEMNRLATDQAYPSDQIKVSHQDLGSMEWKGTLDLARQQAELFGFEFFVTKQRNKEGVNETLLEYVEKRGKWPSNKQRYCTSDFKRGPGARVVTMLTKGMGECKVLYVFGFRAEESPARKKKETLKLNTRLSNKKRTVYDFLPVHDWKATKVWEVIKENNLPYHPAYDKGMPRLSCCFCIFAPFDALVIAGQENPELLQQYVDVEERIGHSFKRDEKIADVKQAIDEGYQPKALHDWVM